MTTLCDLCDKDSATLTIFDDGYEGWYCPTCLPKVQQSYDESFAGKMAAIRRGIDGLGDDPEAARLRGVMDALEQRMTVERDRFLTRYFES